MKYYIIAGEASGDLHGSNLMRQIYLQDRKADFRIWGGDLMRNVYMNNQDGNGLVNNYKDDAVMGFSQVILHIGKFVKKLKACQSDIVTWKPDVVILIDYPGFNFKIAEFAHKKGIKVFYYIAPKVWASRQNRIKMIRNYVDKLFIIFPFEKDYFDRQKIDYVYEGNPLTDAVADFMGNNTGNKDFLLKYDLKDKPYIAILAGSRKSEINSMMPICMEYAKKLNELNEYKNYKFIVAGAPSRTIEDYLGYIPKNNNNIQVIFNHTYQIIKYAKVAIVNSGTASLETCLIGTPQVVAYACSPLNFNIGRHIIKIDMISLGNLILGRKAFKELIQYYFTPENLLSETRRLIEDTEYRENMLHDYELIRAKLGSGNVSAKIAESMIQTLNNSLTRK